MTKRKRGKKEQRAYRCEGIDKVHFSNMDFEDVEIIVTNCGGDTRQAAVIAAAFIESISQGCLCDAVGKRLEPIKGAVKRYRKMEKADRKEVHRQHAAGELS